MARHARRSQESQLMAEESAELGSAWTGQRPVPHTRKSKSRQLALTALLIDRGRTLETSHTRTRVSTAQHRPHAALAIHTSGRAPVHFVGADHSVPATGEFVADTAL